jgi:hypothetical protein
MPRPVVQADTSLDPSRIYAARAEAAKASAKPPEPPEESDILSSQAADYIYTVRRNQHAR